MTRVAQLVYSDTVLRGADVMMVHLAGVQARAGPIEPLVIAAASPEYRRLLDEGGFPCRILPYVHPNRLNHVRVYAGLLRDPPDVDAVHAHGLRALCLVALLRRLSRRWKRVGLVYTVHDSWWDETLRQRLRARLERRQCHQVDVLIACCAAMLPRLQAVPGPRRVDLVPNGVAVRHTTAAADLGYPPGTPVVGIVGRLAREKRIDVFLEVARRLSAQRDDVRFVVVGDGPERDDMERLAARLGIADPVRFLGQVTDVPAVCKALTVLLHTADNEGTPVALLEAMSVGTAIVATQVGGIPDLITPGEHGLLCPAGDAPALTGAVSALLDDPAARATLGRAARARIVAGYSVDAMAERLASLYDLAVHQAGARGTGP